MDYMQEELRRQREALASLLLGGGCRRSGEAGEDGQGAEASFEGLGVQKEPAGSGHLQREVRTARPAEEDFAHPLAREEGLTAVKLSGRRPWTQRAERRAPALETAGQAVPAEFGRQGFVHMKEEGRPGLAGIGMETGADRNEMGHIEAAPVPERRVREFFQAESGGGMAGAESLSRAFQRDARRYDGGFSLY